MKLAKFDTLVLKALRVLDGSSLDSRTADVLLELRTEMDQSKLLLQFDTLFNLLSMTGSVELWKDLREELERRGAVPK